MRYLTLTVDGMGCRHCVREVTARLRDVPGVKTIAANMSTCTVKLTGYMTDEDVIAALADTKYVAHIR